MPNRILKESIRESDSIDKLSWFEEVLFYRLIVSCDDYGRFDGRISVIKNRLFPLKEDLTLKTVSRAIEKLATTGLVALYEFEGKPYLYLPTWTAHQNVRAKRSKYPEPVSVLSSMNASASKCFQQNTQDSNGAHLSEDAPVIQSESISESISVSQSESLSESVSGGADARTRASRADDSELAFIGLKPGEYLGVTRERVERTASDTEELFRRWRPRATPTPLDRRMVFILAWEENALELLDYAFEQAQIAGKVSDWRYIAGVMKTLSARGITTAEEARKWDQLRPDLEEET